MESFNKASVPNLIFNGTRAAELQLPQIKRIENIRVFMENHKASCQNVQEVLEGLEKERRQCENALTQMKEQLNQKEAAKNQIKMKILELQSGLEMGGDGQQKLVKCSMDPDLVECDVTSALEHYNGKKKMAKRDILICKGDIQFVAHLHEIAVMNINDIMQWNAL